MSDRQRIQEVVGLVPAAGQANRLGAIPCSKELLPIGFDTQNEGSGIGPKVVCHNLLKHLRSAGITKTYMVLRDGKWDIPHCLGAGESLGLSLAYLIVNVPFGVPYTLDQAFPFVQHAVVALGFPDILVQSHEVYERLLTQQATTRADVVLGLFEADHPHKVDMVDRDGTGRIRNIEIKPAFTSLRYAWLMAVWTPVFTHFMHDHLHAVNAPGGKELFLGDILQVAIEQGLHVNSVIFSDGSYLDIGTPNDFARAIRSEIG